ncbi:unnamed protein product [Clavelina lepadiformis]|uniref:Uncharacterized protein n=1 Tax=Clavelina lepadiformis TaxID=159417 RepID=A0ABP0H3Y3_CLALP
MTAAFEHAHLCQPQDFIKTNKNWKFVESNSTRKLVEDDYTEECYELDNSVRVKPVMVLQTLIARDGTSVNVELPVACQCVANSEETCRSYECDA